MLPHGAEPTTTSSQLSEHCPPLSETSLADDDSEDSLKTPAVLLAVGGVSCTALRPVSLVLLLDALAHC